MPWTGRKSDSLVCSQRFCERSHVVIFTSDLPLQEACLGNHVLGLCVLIPAVLWFFFPPYACLRTALRWEYHAV